MKIIYNKNPLWTAIKLNKKEKQEFWYKIKIMQMEDMLFNAYYYTKEENFDIKKARQSLNPDYFYTDDKSPLDKCCDEMLNYYVKELQLNHCGDCTAVACACAKCHAEEFLGIETIKGIGKYSSSYIQAAFGKNNEKSLDEAIEYLSKIPEAKKAHDWLVNYKSKYLEN